MTLRPVRIPLPLCLVGVLLLCACEKPVALEKPASKPTQAEKTVCAKLAEYFPTWATDSAPETAANRIDTDASIDAAATFTDVFQSVCPGQLR